MCRGVLSEANEFPSFRTLGLPGLGRDCHQPLDVGCRQPLNVFELPIGRELSLNLAWDVFPILSCPKPTFFNLLVFQFWSIFSHGPKRLTFYFGVLWASEYWSPQRADSGDAAEGSWFCELRRAESNSNCQPSRSHGPEMGSPILKKRLDSTILTKGLLPG